MSYRYVGSELELFSTATNWKSYISRRLTPFIGGRVLEVGAGIGSNIRYLYNDAVKEWTSVEPDPHLADQISKRISCGDLPATCRVVPGTVEMLAPTARFDTILYIDVLEHIADDAGELAGAARRLAPGGNLVVLAPAHPFLFSRFDAAVGHFRRYSRACLAALAPPSCQLRTALMLDSAGFFASLANRLLLSAAEPSRAQIAFWDKILVPISRVIDGVTGHRFGKSVVTIWQRSA